MSKQNIIPLIRWLEPKLTNNLPTIVNCVNDVKFYNECFFGKISIKTGDCVYIQTGAATDSDLLEKAYIAKIEHLYEEFDYNYKESNYFALVKWYSRPFELPKRNIHDENFTFDFEREVIEDCRTSKRIEIETIIKKCKVIEGNVIEENLKADMYVCRYRLIKQEGTTSKYNLLPLNAIISDYKKNPKTPKRSSGGRAGSVELLGTPKLKIKRINSGENFEIVQKTTKTCSVQLEDILTKSVQKSLQVSPFKIVNNSVQKINRGIRNNEDEHNNVSPTKKSKTDYYEPNGNYLNLEEVNVDESPPIHRSSQAKRKLTMESNDDLNYSIVSEENLKITLKISHKENTPSRRTSIDEKTNNTPMRRSTRKKSEILREIENNSTPRKTKPINDLKTTPRQIISRRKSILKTPGGDVYGTPKKTVILTDIIEEHPAAEIHRTPRRTVKKIVDYDDYEEEVTRTPKSSRKSISKTTPKSRKSLTTTPSKTATPSQKLKLIREGIIQPSVQSRTITNNKRRSELQIARDQLHVSAVPNSLPCREKEFDNIYTFLEGKILDQCGGCMYISGLPGTGKTATVTKVIKSLQEQVDQHELPEFEFIDINGMRLTEPQQAYVQIYKQLFHKTVSWQQAHTALEKRFTTPAPKRVLTVLLVDELDIICNRRQDVVYNLLDWPTKSHAKLVVLTIANTMDLPERLLLGKVTSRLGLTRLTFQPYSFKQLQEIVTARLGGTDTFKSDAVQLVARKVAAVSGDARRALDICRRATEITEDSDGSEIVNMLHVQQALAEMIASAKVKAIKCCSRLQQLFLKAVAAEVSRTGIEETTFLGVYNQLESICAFDRVKVPNPGRALQICSTLGSSRLLICEHSRTDLYQKILLNVSSDDIHFALSAKLD